jgi:hypothetical protein
LFLSEREGAAHWGTNAQITTRPEVGLTEFVELPSGRGEDRMIRPSPSTVQRLLIELKAPPTLIAHLQLVHDAAAQIVEKIQRQWPTFTIDADAVLFGASIHDIGKVLHPEELTGPGNLHEQAGPELLRRLGFPPERSRFARTHGEWQDTPGVPVEDLLVALADHVWKGARDEELESKVATCIADDLGLAEWEAFLVIDEIMGEIATHGDERLIWQRKAISN